MISNRLLNIIQWIGLLLVLSSLVIGLQYYFNERVNSCASNPLVYSARYMEETYGYPFVGSGSFIIKGQTSPVIIYFNSDNITVESIESSSYITNYSIKNIEL